MAYERSAAHGIGKVVIIIQEGQDNPESLTWVLDKFLVNWHFGPKYIFKTAAVAAIFAFWLERV